MSKAGVSGLPQGMIASNGIIPADAIPIGGEAVPKSEPGGQLQTPVAAPGMSEFDKIASQMKGAVQMQSRAQTRSCSASKSASKKKT